VRGNTVGIDKGLDGDSLAEGFAAFGIIDDVIDLCTQPERGGMDEGLTSLSNMAWTIARLHPERTRPRIHLPVLGGSGQGVCLIHVRVHSLQYLGVTAE
jgi:hypothetical protein